MRVPIAVRLDNTDNIQKKPCANCPWRTDVPPGEFPVEKYRDLAATAYDMSHKIFTCHKSKEENPIVCAGFLLKGAQHNLTVRLNYGKQRREVSDGGYPLHKGYREMAIANGVDPDDEVLKPCR